MRRVRRGGLQRQADRLGNLRITNLPRCAAARLVVKPINSPLGKPTTPFTDRVLVGPDEFGNRLILHAIRCRKHNPGAARQSLRGSSAARQAFQLAPLRRRQLDCDRRLPHCDRPPDFPKRMITQISRSRH
jgi:hypothetical protein